MGFPEPLITKEQLSELLGLDSVKGIEAQCAAKAWPHRMVRGKYRFSEDDVAAIYELVKRGPEAPPPPVSAPQAPRKRRSRQTPPPVTTSGSGLTGLTAMPVTPRRGYSP